MNLGVVTVGNKSYKTIISLTSNASFPTFMYNKIIRQSTAFNNPFQQTNSFSSTVIDRGEYEFLINA